MGAAVTQLAAGAGAAGSDGPLPRRFGAYTLLRSLGRGGMGEVFLARKPGLVGASPLCVIKTVRADLLEQHEYVQRFTDEARLAVTLTHAGICHVFDAGRVGEAMFIAMEHIAGVTVRDIIDTLAMRGETVPLAVGLHIVLEWLDALEYAHTHMHPETGLPLRVVHRDVSPQNVMVSFDGDVKLIDFGLASSGLKALQTGDDQVMGKLAYMAPEQVQGSKLDGRADMYASGILAVELLCGERFYGDLDNAEVTRRVAAGGHRPACMQRLPAGVVRALDKALAPHRDLRFASCAALAVALRAELALVDPLMSRAALRAWVQQHLADARAAHRALLRTLPSGDDEEQTERQRPAPGNPPSSDSGSQKAMVLEAPRTEAMARPPGALASADSDVEDEEDEPPTDRDFAAPDEVALELAERPRPPRAPVEPLSTSPQGTAAAPPAAGGARGSLAAALVVVALAAIVAVAWVLSR